MTLDFENFQGVIKLVWVFQNGRALKGSKMVLKNYKLYNYYNYYYNLMTLTCLFRAL